MSKLRIIARVDIKNEYVIKGIHLEGLRKVGNPIELAKKYYENGIDEIIFMDSVAAYYDRNSLSKIIKEASKDVFIPITVGGGIRTLEDIQQALSVGADKVAINTQAVQTPHFLQDAAQRFGSQCIVASIVAKKIDTNKYEVYTENAREATGKDVLEWAKEVEALGVGEIMLTSIDKEGTKKGFDAELCKLITQHVNLPIIVSGGMKTSDDILKLFQHTQVDAIATASTLHYNLEDIQSIKQNLQKHNIKVRV